MGSARWRLVVLFVLVAVAASVGCGKAKDTEQVATGEDPLDVLSQSAQETLGEETFRFEVSFELKGDYGSQVPDDPCYPEPDLREIEEIIGGWADRSSGLMRFDLPEGEIGTPMLLADDEMYLATANLPREWAIETEWLRIDFPAGAAFFGAFGIAGGAGATVDPSSLLESISSTATSVEQVGQEEIRDAATTVYRLELDQERYEQEQRALIEQMAEIYPDEEYPELEEDGWFMLPVLEVAVDEQGLVRRIDSWVPNEEAPIETLDSLPEGVTIPEMPEMTFPEAHTVVEFYDFGQAPAIDAPADDEVTDAAEIGIEMADLDDAASAASEEELDEELAEESALFDEELPPGCEEETAVGEAVDGGELPFSMANAVDDAVLRCYELPTETGATVVDDSLLITDDPDYSACLPTDVLAAVTCVEDEVRARDLEVAQDLPRDVFADGSAMMACVPEHLRADVRCSFILAPYEQTSSTSCLE